MLLLGSMKYEVLMSDSFKSILEMGTLSGGNSTYFSNHNDETKRQLVTAAVLELIKADLSAGSPGGLTLGMHLEILDEMVDRVLSTLNGEEN